MKKPLAATIVLLTILLVPSIIIGEIIYSAPRNKDYADLPLLGGSIVTSDGISIRFWYSNESENLVIFTHGHGDNSKILFERTNALLVNQTYDVLFLDLRNHGRSSKKPPVSFGVYESKDLIGVIEWATSKHWKSIVLYGTSMGAVATYLAYDSLLRKEKVSGLVLDSSYESIKEVLNLNLKKNYIIQPWRFLVIKYLLDIRGRNIQFPSLLQFLNSTPNLPILVIHGGKDVEAPPSIITKINALGLPNVSTLLIEEGKHSRLLSIPTVILKINSFLSTIFKNKDPFLSQFFSDPLTP